MRRYLTTICLLLALLLPSAALAQTRVGCGISQPCAAGGTSIVTEATYADLITAGCTTQGDIGYTEDLDLYWICNDATGLWLPPDVQPATVDLADYTGAALPTASAPAWTAEGAGSGAVAGGELTITGAVRYYITDAVNMAVTKNIGLIARAKVTTQAGVGSPVNAYLALRPGNLGGWAGIPMLAFAGHASLSHATNVYPNYVVGDERAETQSSVDNAVYQYYFIWYNGAGRVARMGSLGAGPQYGGRLHWFVYFGGSPDAATASWGSYTGGNVTVWDRVILFTF